MFAFMSVGYREDSSRFYKFSCNKRNLTLTIKTEYLFCNFCSYDRCDFFFLCHKIQIKSRYRVLPLFPILNTN